MTGWRRRIPLRSISVSHGSVPTPVRNRQLWPMISSLQYPVNATKAALHSTIGLSRNRGLLMTAAMGLDPIMEDTDIVPVRVADGGKFEKCPFGHLGVFAAAAHLAG